MRSKPSLSLRVAFYAGMLFLHFPIFIIVLYAITTEDRTYRFPPPGLTLKWFEKALQRQDMWAALGLSLQVAAIATLIALVLGTMVAAAMYRFHFLGKDLITSLLILPIALPGIVTGIALRSAIGMTDIPFSFWTIVIGHATFCVVTVYNNALARFRRMGHSQVEASMDLGANGWQTFRYIILPNLGTALLAGGMLAFALSFDEVIVTTFTAGQQNTLPIWIFSQLTRPRDRAITNVVAMFVIAITFLPIYFSHKLTQEKE